MTGPRYVPPKALRDLLAGSLYWSGVAVEDPGRDLARAARWHAALVGGGLEEVPFQVVFDLGLLLLEGNAQPLGVAVWFERYPADERALRVRYGNGFLAAYSERGWFLRAHDLVAASADPDEAVVYVLEKILTPLVARDLGEAEEEALVLQPSRFGQLPWDRVAQEVREQGPLVAYRKALDEYETWLGRPGALGRRLARFLDAAGVRAGQRALGEDDLFELQHLKWLDTRARRLAARHLKRAELLLPPVAAGALAPVAEVAEVDVDVQDEGTYPSGGLDGLATRGTWENLVPTELIYIDENADPDLFTVRTVEHELLFYTRDGGHLRRRRRAVHVIVERDPTWAVKYPEHPFRLDLMICGLVARLVEDVLMVFEKDACTVTLHVLGEEGDEAARLMRLRFSAEIGRGEVAVRAAAAVDPEDFADPRRRTVVFWIARNGALDAARREALERVGIASRAIELGPEDEAVEGVVPLPVDGELLPAMRQARDRMLEVLLGAG